MVFQGNHPTFSMKLNEFLSSRASVGGLPHDILFLAYKGYEVGIVSWDFVCSRLDEVRRDLLNRMPEAIVDCSLHPDTDPEKACGALTVYHLSAGPMDNTQEAFLNGASNTFIFWRWGVWLLQTHDVVGATGHLHRRVMTRDPSDRFSFTALHEAISTYWPALVEVAQKRRLSGQNAALTYFSIPFGDGVICAEFQKLREVHRFLPSLKVLKQQTVQNFSLPHPYANGDDHLLVLAKTFLKRLNGNQKSLYSMLKEFEGRHELALKRLKRKARMLYSSSQIGVQMSRAFNDDVIDMRTITDAIIELDHLTSSPEWITESNRNQRSSTSSQT